jgi:hypothetical protein
MAVGPHGLTAVVPLVTPAEPAEACPLSPSRRRAKALWRQRGFGGHRHAFLHRLSLLRRGTPPKRLRPSREGGSSIGYEGRAAVASCVGG